VDSRGVLVVAEDGDVHARAVCAILRREHGIDPIMVDTTSFPGKAGSFHLSESCPSNVFDGAEMFGVRSVWWRRAFPCDVPQSVNLSHNEYRQAECDGFIQGLLWSLPATWVNDPGAERVASRKIVQLAAAKSAGLPVPETLITNDPERASEFIAARPVPTIYKRTGTSRSEFSETRLIGSEDLQRLGSIVSSPTTFQDYIEAEADIRVVWVAGKVWAVRIDSQSGAGWLDSRLDNRVEFTLVELPQKTTTALQVCMLRLGLVFGVIDLRVGTDGEIYFLEVNPQGQFAYLEFKTGAPIFRSVADLLQDPRRKDGSHGGWDAKSGAARAGGRREDAPALGGNQRAAL
jgi:hypothetical protein